MEIGELVNVEIPDVKAKKKCPFSHEPPNPKEENELGGLGSKLVDNLKDGIGVHTSKPPIGADFQKGEKEKDPRDRSGKHKCTHVSIKVDGETVTLDNGDNLYYPVTCAAHHLIPAQESLKGHEILQFMCKNGEPQKFRNGKKEVTETVESRVWGNVAYNVNGCQNGVWLPGNYAVGAGTGGVKVWKERATKLTKKQAKVAAENWDFSDEEWDYLSDDPEEDEKPSAAAIQTQLSGASASDIMLAGTNYNISELNPKWAYVKAAMDGAKAQFHDRHETYSEKVQEYLTKLFAHYDGAAIRSIDSCKQCEKAGRAEGADESLVGPPYEIVDRLRVASAFFRNIVGVNQVSAGNIYTSDWIKAWIAKAPKSKWKKSR